MLRTSTGMQSLYVYDGTGNPTALLTSGAYTAFAYDYDPYGVRAITTDSGGNGTTQNPYTFKAGIQDRVTGWVKFGARWYDPTLGRWTSRTPSTHRSTLPMRTATLTRQTTPSTTRIRSAWPLLAPESSAGSLVPSLASPLESSPE
jgi:RHS repeat-associated protein